MHAKLQNERQKIPDARHAILYRRQNMGDERQDQNGNKQLRANAYKN